MLGKFIHLRVYDQKQYYNYPIQKHSVEYFPIVCPSLLYSMSITLTCQNSSEFIPLHSLS